MTGLAFATSNSSLGAEYVEDLFVADFPRGQIYRFELNAMRDGLALADDGREQPERAGPAPLRERLRPAASADLKEGPDGALYVVASASAPSTDRGRRRPGVHDLAVAP